MAALVVPAASRAVTETELEPLALIARVPDVGVAVSVSMLQVPVVAEMAELVEEVEMSSMEVAS